MRWDNLFDDLESQLEHELTSEDLDLRAEEERLRLGRLSLRDRIVALHRHSDTEHSDAGYSLRIGLLSGNDIAVRPTTFGRDWFAARLDGRRERSAQCIVPLAAIASVHLDRARLAESLDATPGELSGASLSARLSLPFVLRDVCRRRASVELATLTGTVHGTIDRVGRDHLDLALHPPGGPRRESLVTGYRLVPLSQLVLITF